MMHEDKVESLKAEISEAKAHSQEELEAYRMKYISKKSVVGELFAAMRDIPNDQNKEYGRQ